jgi:dolichol-phosphate mannosyltransferase
VPTLTVIIPCFNEEAVLPQLFERLSTAAQTWGVDWDVLCVDDGSRDKTWELLREQHARDPRWRAIRFSRNFGHQLAVSAGLRHAKADAVVVMDADLQDPPEVVKEFIAKWREGSEVVYGRRKKRKDKTLKRLLAWSYYRLLAGIVDFKLPLDSGDFCLMDKKVVAALSAMPERNRYLRGMRAWLGFRQAEVPYDRPDRAAGEPKYTFKKSLKLALEGIYSFSTAPLKFVSHLGAWISVLAFIGVVFTLLQRIFKHFFTSIGMEPLPGFATIVMSVLFMGGVQLLCLGVIGEYVGRIYDEVKGRPRGVIAESCGVDVENQNV